jgi:protein-S-isoprenylcysteine O-methyltransferase Ste14
MAIGLLTLALLGTLSFAGTMLLGYRVPADPSAMRHHFLAALGTTTLLVMAHSFIMFFLIATGVELKDMEKARGWGDSFRRRTIALKSRVFPAMTFALLLVIANFMLGAAAHTRAVPPIVHHATAWLTVAVCLLALYREYRVLGDNNRLIAEAASRREDSGATGDA